MRRFRVHNGYYIEASATRLPTGDYGSFVEIVRLNGGSLTEGKKRVHPFGAQAFSTTFEAVTASMEYGLTVADGIVNFDALKAK